MAVTTGTGANPNAGGTGFQMNPFGFLAGGMLGSGLGNLFGGNPTDAANPFFNQAQGYAGALPGQLQNIFGPYMQNAQSMYGPLSAQLQALMGNPGGMLNQIGQGYNASPGYEWMKSQALQAGQQAANAGGMAGTPANQQQQMQVASQLANQDYYNYLNQATGLFGQGLQGAQNIYGGGLNAAGQYGQGLSNTAALQAQLAMQQAQAAAAGQQQENQGWGNMLGGILGIAGSFIPGLGPIGGMAGSAIGKAIGG